MLNGHGDDIYDRPNNIVANFSSNVWYGGCRTELTEHLCKSLAKINYYPEVTGSSLAKCLAEKHRLTEGSVLVTNGAVESIYLVAQFFAGVKTTIITPSFSEYEDACRIHHHPLCFKNIENLCEGTTFDSKIVFFCNPNNPTGHLFTPSLIEKWVSGFPETLFVLDEAYCGFSVADSSCLSFVSQYSNLLVIRSMTKVFSIPGLRLGYLVGQPELIEKLLEIKMPWSVNTLALEAGHYILDHELLFQIPVKTMLTETQRFMSEICLIPDVEVLPSATNFFLCYLQKGTAADLKHYLLHEYGILIRDASNFQGLSAGHFRLATLDRERNDLFIKALTQWLTTLS